MAVAGYNLEDPLKRVMPKTGIVQNSNSLAKTTAPLALRPPTPQGVRTSTPGPQPIRAGEPAPGTGTVTPPVAAPTPPPVNPVPAAVTPPAPDLYGKSGGASAPAGSLEDQIRQVITGFTSGATSKGFIDRAKSALGSAVEGQRQQALRRSDADLIRRGLFRSGLGAEQAQAIDTGAQSTLSQGIADILGKAEQQDIAAKESAAGIAGNLLSSNRAWDQYSQQRADEQAARAAANAPRDTTFQYMDPDTGEVYTLDEAWFQ